MGKPHIKILFLDDDKQFEETFQRYVKRKEKKFDIETVVARDLAKASECVDNTYDAAIVDLKLKDGERGEAFIKKIAEEYRIPVFVYSGQPNDLSDDVRKFVLGLYDRSSEKYEAVLNDIIAIYKTGLTNITRERGTLEELVNTVFWKSIVPNLENWKSYAANGNDTQPALFRSIMYHFIDQLDNEYEDAFPEEMFICSEQGCELPGTIYKNKESKKFYLNITPACDLAQNKTSHIQLCQLEECLAGFYHNPKAKASLEDQKKNYAGTVINNGYNYMHYLPAFGDLPMQVVNFRKLSFISRRELESCYELTGVRIAAPFLKDVIARFSAYYARQGQPDLKGGSQVLKAVVGV